MFKIGTGTQRDADDTGWDPGLADLAGWTPSSSWQFPHSSTGGAAGWDAAGWDGSRISALQMLYPTGLPVGKSQLPPCRSGVPRCYTWAAESPQGNNLALSLREIDAGLKRAWEAGRPLVPQWCEVWPHRQASCLETDLHTDTGLPLSLTQDFTDYSCLHACFPHDSSSPRETLSQGDTVGVESASGLPAVFLAIQQIHTTLYANTRKW